jgi:hypothetical protein
MEEISLHNFGKSLKKQIPSIGSRKVTQFLRREGYLKKGRYIHEPTEKAEGLLGIRRVYTDGGTRKNSYLQVYVTEDGVRLFTDMISSEYEDFGPWEIRSNWRNNDQLD